MLNIFSSIPRSQQLDAKITLPVISDFYQGQVKVTEQMKNCLGNTVVGNCATIALIKVALLEYGELRHIFKKFTEAKGVISAKFKDGTKVSIDQKEIATVIHLADIKEGLNSTLHNSAIVAYALICKRVLKKRRSYNSKCIKTFDDAVMFVNSGYETENVVELLALKKKSIPVKKIKKYSHVVIWNNVHAAYCTYGVQDILGKKHEVKDGFMKNPIDPPSKISNAFILTQ